MKISYFKFGVGNTTSFDLINWKQLYNLLQTPSNTLPKPIGSKKWENRKKRSEYIVRGKLTGSRSDDNLQYGCLIILDGDRGRFNVELSSADEVHKVMRPFSHIVTTTPTPGRWRLIVPVKKYHPADTDEVTLQLYNFLVNSGICVEYAGESKVNSQPWFIRAVTEGEEYKVYGTKNGKQWKIRPVIPKKEQFVARPVHGGSRLKMFIDELKSGTIHQAAKAYIGWQLRVTNLTLGQILEDVTVLIKEHCSQPQKIKRWLSTERQQLEEWYAKQNFIAPTFEKDMVFTPPISDAIQYDSKGWPYLDLNIQQPSDMFGKIVRALIDKQQAVYNPDLAFWIALSLVDYIAGCGYASVLSKRCDPIYCFTSGNSSQGKTATIQAAKMYLDEIINSEQFVADTANKRIITRVGSAEGVYDLVTGQLQDGCDILFIQDEFGSVAKARSDGQTASFQEMFLYLATISRNDAVEARLLATANKKLKEYAKRRDVHCCHFNYFTTTTNETLRGILSSSDFGSGFLQRFIGGIGRSKHFNTKIAVYGHVESVSGFDGDVIETLGMLLAYSSSVVGRQRINAPLHVGISKKARKYHKELAHHCILMEDVRYNKIAENVLPVARARALVENPENPVVKLTHMQWAHCVVLCSVQYFDWLLKNLKKVNTDAFPKYCKKIHAYLLKKRITSKKSAVPLREINVRKPSGTMSTARDALEHLYKDGFVEKITVTTKYQTYDRWYATRKAAAPEMENHSESDN